AVALAFPSGDQQRLGISRVYLHVDDAGLVVDGQYLAPRLAAIAGLVQAALLVRSPQAAERADINDVGILRMNGDAADLERFFEAHVRPGLATVGRFVDAVAPAGGVARVVLARADPDDLRIGRGDRDIANRDGRFAVELVLEGGAAVGRLEQAAR